MKIRLAEIPEDGLEIHETRSGEWIKKTLAMDESDLFVPCSPLTIDLSFSKHNRRVSVKGMIGADFNFICSRCTSPGQMSLKLRIREMFLPADKFNPPEGGKMDLGASDFKHTFYEDDEIELGGYLAETMRLSLPMYPRCMDEASCHPGPVVFGEDWEIDEGGKEESMPVNPAWREGLSRIKMTFNGDKDEV